MGHRANYIRNDSIGFDQNLANAMLKTNIAGSSFAPEYWSPDFLFAGIYSSYKPVYKNLRSNFAIFEEKVWKTSGWILLVNIDEYVIGQIQIM